MKINKSTNRSRLLVFTPIWAAMLMQDTLGVIYVLLFSDWLSQHTAHMYARFTGCVAAHPLTLYLHTVSVLKINTLQMKRKNEITAMKQKKNKLMK